jgi:hypothetical protein
MDEASWLRKGRMAVANRLAGRLQRDQRVRTKSDLNASHLDEHWQ